jgi:ribose/xylose/arabinose/galactoside ABC-type transport system permease subunit
MKDEAHAASGPPFLTPRPLQVFLRRLFARTEWGLLAAIGVVVLLTAAIDTQHIYFTRPGDSAVNILRQTALLGIFALGAAVVIIAGGIDLSSGSVIAFSGTVCAIILLQLAPQEMRQGEPIRIGYLAIAVAATLIVGFLIGSLHTWLITIVGLPPFVATLAAVSAGAWSPISPTAAAKSRSSTNASATWPPRSGSRSAYSWG